MGETPAPGDIPGLTEHLFRQEAGKLVSVLTGIFGIDRLQLAEDVVQDAMIRALQTWPYYGVPANPAAWLMQTAKHRALDVIRRERFFHDKQSEITIAIGERLSEEEETPRFDDEIKDDRLRLMFACCHPNISHEAQTALALKMLCGFSPAEIASAFMTTEAAIAKRLTRARHSIREMGIPFEIPTGEELSSRLNSVLQILYLLFNEGYKASSGESLIREELCEQAIQLGRLLAGHPAANQPRTHALVALMLLNASRLRSRTDREGNILRLKDQDRTTWDRQMIGQGLLHLGQAAAGEELSEYHLQAGIAACHATAATFALTDWPRILAHYDAWAKINDSPIIALNRAVALAKVAGTPAGIAAVKAILSRGQLKSYYLAYAVLGEFEAEMGQYQAASTYFQKALQHSEVKIEQSFLEERMRDPEGRFRPPSPIIPDF
ncbi:RNA polymerase sigma factor [soil metagenome]